LVLLLGQAVDGSVYRPVESAAIVMERAEYSAELPSYRKDVQAMELAVTGQEHMLKSAGMKFLPSINAFGSFQLYDDHLFGMNASGYVIGARMSWNLFDGYTSISKHTKARLEAERAHLQREQYTAQQQAELVKTHRMLADADSKVVTTTLAFEQAQEAYRMRKDRFVAGLEKTTDLLMSETHLYQKELAYKQAIFEYNFTKEYLHFLTR
jgi:outer membrane protein TolC